MEKRKVKKVIYFSPSLTTEKVAKASAEKIEGNKEYYDVLAQRIEETVECAAGAYGERKEPEYFL